MRAIAIALLLVAAAVASDVLVLTDDNFDEAIKAHDKILVEFYAPWCGHCKRLEPEYDAAATALKGKFVLAKVDATENRAVASRFGIQGYPTIKLFRDGEPTDYQGGRTKDTIVSYLLKQSRPAITHLEIAEIEEFAKGDKVVVIGSFSSKDSAAYRVFARVAQNLAADLTFGAHIADEHTAHKVTVYKQFDNENSVFTSELSTPTLTAFLKSESIPLVDEVGPENYRTYVEAKLPLLFGFVDPSDIAQKAALIELLVPLAKLYRGVVNFVWCDGVKYANQAKNLGLPGTFLPAVAIVNVESNDHYAFAGSLAADSDEFAKWLADFADGKVAPTIKSQPEPETQDGPVTILVGSNFQKIISDPTKDVLVEFYAPWCGHCKNLAPIYDELGEKFKGVESVVIAKMDATENDAPGMRIQGFPTIKFFPASNKTPIDFEGDRTLEGFVKFIQTRASIPFTLGGAAHAHDHDHDHHGHDHGDEL